MMHSSDLGYHSLLRRLSQREREQFQEQPTAKELKKRDVPLTPMMKALIQMEETKATEGRALSKTSYSSRIRIFHLLLVSWF